jgi:superfamily II DNA or RNA helicase
MQSLFETVRDCASRRAWSRGVELARAKAVTVERIDEREAQLRVAVAGRPVAPLVTLLLDADAWSCECAGDEDPCEHVAAAVIALRRAREEGRALPTREESGAGVLHYELRRAGGGLALDRVVVRGAERTPLAASLRAIASGRVAGPRVDASEADLAVDDAIQGIGGRVLSRGALVRVLRSLASSERVTLDGVPVRTSAEPLTPEATLTDHDGDFLLRVDLRPGVTGTVGDDLVLCGDVIRPLRETRLDAREIAEYPRGKRFRAGEAARLAGEILPDLARRIPVDVRTSRLPRTTRSEPPRARVATSRDGDALVARADVVYGDPPAARVVAGQLLAIQGVVPIRNEAGERAAARRIQSELELPIGSEVSVRGEEAIALAERLARFGGAVAGDAHRAFFRAPPLAARVSAERGFEVWFECEPEAGGRAARRVSGDAVLRAWRDGDAFVLLPGGGLAPLPADWLARFGREVADLLEARDADGALPRAALPALARLCDELALPRPADLGALAALAGDFTGIPRTALPADLTATLRGYQQSAVDWLVFLRDAGLGALLADDMGLGKTLEVLCALRAGERTLVVAPTSVLFNWAEELRRFRPGLSFARYHGPDRALDPRADVTITSYAILRLDADALAAVAWDAVVLDEAQAIKNPDSQVARAAHALKARWRVAMTGTPVENRLDELWSQLHFANPGLLGTRAAFDERWARPIAAADARAVTALRARIRPFVLRRRKAEVAPELPPRIEVVLHVELDENERRVYDAVRAATRADVLAKLAAGGSVLAALEALLRLRQAACHVGLVPGQTAETSSKVELLVEELATAVAEGHKALVFSQWTSLLDRVEPRLRAAGLAWTRLDGSTRDRAGVVAAFQDEAGPPVLLISLQAGGTGLNLTAADHVFLLDPWWNPAVEDQAADRAHRIGQEKPVLVHRLVASDTVEERVLALQAAKRSLADAALGGAATATSLTRDDLLALLA